MRLFTSKATGPGNPRPFLFLEARHNLFFKKLLTIGTSLLIGEEIPFQRAEKLPFSEEKQSQFFYLSGGLNTLLPTVSIGYQKIYGSFGSDVSVSGSKIISC